MEKIVDAAIVAVMLMMSCPEALPADLSDIPSAQMIEVSRGDRPC